jgi:hypothetical protein
VLKGDLQGRLKISKETVGLLVGDLPEELRRNMFRGTPAPKSARIELLRGKEGVDVRFQVALENADDAKAFTAFIVKGREQLLEQLKKMPADVPLPPSAVTALRKAVESLQIQAKESGVEGAIFLPSDALLSAPSWFLFGQGPDAPPPPPPAKLPPLPAGLQPR